MQNIAIPTPEGSFWGLKFHQVAIYHHAPEEAIDFWVDAGYTEWHKDEALLVGTEYGETSIKNAQMFFNYDILPLELEYVNYNTRFRHRQDRRTGEPPFISHMSVYVEDIEAELSRIYHVYGDWPYHRFVTNHHTNPNVLGKKRFMEAIYSTERYLGYDIKLIQRVGWDMRDEEVQRWANLECPKG